MATFDEKTFKILSRILKDNYYKTWWKSFGRVQKGKWRK